MDWAGLCNLTEGSGGQNQVEGDGQNVIRGAPTTNRLREQVAGSNIAEHGNVPGRLISCITYEREQTIIETGSVGYGWRYAAHVIHAFLV